MSRINISAMETGRSRERAVFISVAVDTEDALLTCSNGWAQEVKMITSQLQQCGVEVPLLPQIVSRPWGQYTVLEEASHYKVKRLVVYPGAALSLQFHRQRSEHWVVVTGTAQVRNGEHEFLLHIGQSTYVPQGVTHRLSNPVDTQLEVIEVQTGSYLGEDDIVRLDDLYQRA